MRSRYIKKNELRSMRTTTDADTWLPFRVMLETGLRVGDVVALRREDIHRRGNAPVIEFRAQKTGKKGAAPISEQLFVTLRRRPAGFLFPGSGKTGHITRQALWSRVKRLCADAGLDPEGKSPHSFRKDFAVDLMHSQGLAAVREALQHADDAVTRVYAYSDTIMQTDSDEPIRWRDLELVVDYIIQRVRGG